MKIYMDFYTPIIAAWVSQLLLLCDWPVTHPAIEYINLWVKRPTQHITGHFVDESFKAIIKIGGNLTKF